MGLTTITDENKSAGLPWNGIAGCTRLVRIRAHATPGKWSENGPAGSKPRLQTCIYYTSSGTSCGGGRERGAHNERAGDDAFQHPGDNTDPLYIMCFT